MRYHLALIISALGSATLLSGCFTPAQLAAAAPYVQAGNAAGATIAGVVSPAIAVPAGLVAGALNQAITNSTGK